MEPAMQVVVYAQDLSGRRDDGHYTKPSISEALDIFFSAPEEINFLDDSGEHSIDRTEAEAIFDQDSEVSFYNADGEKVVISLDVSRSYQAI
jgi:hypothetical protein